jgi:hypothetical protein
MTTAPAKPYPSPTTIATPFAIDLDSGSLPIMGFMGLLNNTAANNLKITLNNAACHH